MATGYLNVECYLLVGNTATLSSDVGHVEDDSGTVYAGMCEVPIGGMNLYARPQAGYYLGYWHYDPASAPAASYYGNPLVADILPDFHGETKVQAYFVAGTPPTTYTVTVAASPANGGSVSGGGTYNSGDPCTIVATPNDGFRFVKWRGTYDISAATYTFPVTCDVTLTADFAVIMPVWVQGTYRPSISRVRANVSDEAPYDLRLYNTGDTVPLSTAAGVTETGWAFAYWEDPSGDVSSVASRQFSLTEDYVEQYATPWTYDASQKLLVFTAVAVQRYAIRLYHCIDRGDIPAGLPLPYQLPQLSWHADYAPYVRSSGDALLLPFYAGTVPVTYDSYDDPTTTDNWLLVADADGAETDCYYYGVRFYVYSYNNGVRSIVRDETLLRSDYGSDRELMQDVLMRLFGYEQDIFAPEYLLRSGSFNPGRVTDSGVVMDVGIVYLFRSRAPTYRILRSASTGRILHGTGGTILYDD